MNIKKITAMTVCGVCLSSLCACSYRQVVWDQSTSEIRFSWWGNDERNECTLEGIAVFENNNEDISISPEYSEFAGFKSKMDAEIYSDGEADLMQLNYDWLYEYSPDGEGFYDLNELSDHIDLSNFSEQDMEFGTINGKLNALPTGVTAVTFIYNKTLYDTYGLELPKTWDDLFEAAKIMRMDETYPLQLSEKNFWLVCLAYLEQTTGKKAFDDSGSFILENEDMEIMLEFYLRLVNEKVSKRGTEFDRSDFGNIKIGGLAVWESDSGYYYDVAEESGFNVVVGDYITTDNYKSFGWYAKPSGLYAIKKGTSEPEAAADLMDFMLNSSDMAVLQGSTRGMPVSRSAMETLEAHEMLSGLEYEAMLKRKATPQLEVMSPYVEDSEIISIFTDACDSIYYEKSHIEDAAKKACDGIRAYLKKK